MGTRTLLGRVTGVMLLLEAIWIAVGTLAAVRYAQVMSTFEGGPPMSSSEVLAGYAIGFALATAFGLAGLYLVGVLAMFRRAGPWIVLIAAAANGFVAVTVAVSRLTSRGASDAGLLTAMITGVAAVCSLFFWRSTRRSRT